MRSPTLRSLEREVRKFRAAEQLLRDQRALWRTDQKDTWLTAEMLRADRVVDHLARVIARRLSRWLETGRRA